jgi:hypothetical protein
MPGWPDRPPVEQSQIYVLAAPGMLAGLQGRQNRRAGIQPGEDVGQRHAHLHGAASGLAIGMARDAHQPPHALDQKVIARTVRIGTVWPKP